MLTIEMGMTMPDTKTAAPQIKPSERIANKAMALYLDELRKRRMDTFPRRSAEANLWTRKGVAERINRQGVVAKISTLDRAMAGRGTEYGAIVVWTAIVSGTAEHLAQIAASSNPIELARQLARQRWTEIGQEKSRQRRTGLIDKTATAQFLDADVEKLARLFEDNPKLKKQILAFVEAVKD